MWILATGLWSDGGVWIDTAFWIDLPFNRRHKHYALTM
jgi:hypothetical protein